MNLSPAIFVYNALSLPIAIAIWVAHGALGRPDDARDFGLFASGMVVSLGLWSLAAVLNAMALDVIGDAAYVTSVMFLLRGSARAIDAGDAPGRAILIGGLVTLTILVIIELIPGGRPYRLALTMLMASALHAVVSMIVFRSVQTAQLARERSMFLVFTGGLTLLLIARAALLVLSGHSTNQALARAQSILLLVFGVLYTGLFFSLIVYGFQRLVTQLSEAQDRVGSRERWVTVAKLFSGIAHEIGTPIGNLVTTLTAAAREAEPDEALAASLSQAGRRLSVTGARISRYHGLLMGRRHSSDTFDMSDALNVAAEVADYALGIPCTVDCPVGLRVTGAPADLAISTVMVLQQSRLVSTRAYGDARLVCSVYGSDASIEVLGLEWPEETVQHLLSNRISWIDAVGTQWRNLGLAASTIRNELHGRIDTLHVRDGYTLALHIPLAEDDHGR